MTIGGMHFKMRRLSRSERGLSEIVGTLMLVVIVVSAATLLAAFVATYQKQLQAEESLSHDQALESIKILGLVTALNNAGTAYRNINFTLASEYINPSTILSISINNYPLIQFWWEDLTTHVWSEDSQFSKLALGPEQEILVSTNTSHTNNSFLVPPPPPNQYLKFDVDTVLQNDFSRVFLPPTALAVISEIIPSPSNPITLLDGSQSFQPGGNASIVNWGWNVSGAAFGSAPIVSGTDGILTQSSATPLGNGLYSYTGTATADFTVPPNWVYEPEDPLYPTAPSTSITNSGGTGCTVNSASFTSTSGSGSAGAATVQFDFSIVFVCTGTAGSVAFFGTADATLANYVVANGEEVEISPALPADTYTALLVVTNSDGLVGSATLSYTAP